MKQIRNYVIWNARLSSAGQPNTKQLRNLGASGFTVVMNLAMPTRRAHVREDFILARQGIAYVHIPVLWNAPAYRDLMRFFDVMDIYAGENILVHCAMNMRATVFVFLYLTLHKNFPTKKAFGIMRKVWQPNDVWQHFMDTSIACYKEEHQYG